MSDSQHAVTAALYKKLLRVMAEIGHLEKRGEMKAKRKGSDQEYVQYHYLRASDLFDAVRPLFLREKLLILPELLEQERWEVRRESGGVSNFINVSYRFHFIDAETAARDFFDGSGSGMDSGDKSAQKAALVALKYALRNVLLIADDSDDADAPAKEASDTPKKRKSRDNYQGVDGVVTELRPMSPEAVWLQVNNNGLWIVTSRIVDADRLRKSLGCKVELTGRWDTTKVNGKPVNVLTVTSVHGVYNAVPRTDFVPREEDDTHLSPDMIEAGFGGRKNH